MTRCTCDVWRVEDSEGELVNTFESREFFDRGRRSAIELAERLEDEEPDRSPFRVRLVPEGTEYDAEQCESYPVEYPEDGGSS